MAQNGTNQLITIELRNPVKLAFIIPESIRATNSKPTRAHSRIVLSKRQAGRLPYYLQPVPTLTSLDFGDFKGFLTRHEFRDI